MIRRAQDWTKERTLNLGPRGERPLLHALSNDSTPDGVDCECQDPRVQTITTLGYGVEACNPVCFLNLMFSGDKPEPFLWVRIFDRHAFADAYHFIYPDGTWDSETLPEKWQDAASLDEPTVLLFSSETVGGLWFSLAEWAQLEAGISVPYTWATNGYVWG